MRKLSILLSALLLAGTLSANAFDPQSLLNKLGGASQNEESGSKKSDIAGALGGVLNSFVANDKFSIDDIVGEWTYASPAVSFESDNALQKIGGAGAASVAESKLEPYYKRLKLNSTTLTVDAEHNFTLKLGVASLKGTIEKDENDALIFNFNAFGKISLGKAYAHATKANDTLNLTFDATRLVQILTQISSKLNNGTLNTLSTLLNSYDGIYIGFKLNSK